MSHDSRQMRPKSTYSAGPRRAILLFATSASVLAHELLLMRMLSFAFWHHFASMVISISLLGFGAAGAFLFLAYERVKRDPEGFLALLAAAAAVSFPGSLVLFRASGLDPLQLVWQGGEWLNMAWAYLALSMPFLFAGGIVGTILSRAGERTPRMYAADLGGAGAGALAVVPALWLASPWALLPVLGAVLILAAVPCARAAMPRARGFLSLGFAAAMLAAGAAAVSPAPRVHEAKELPQTLAFPDARIEAFRLSPQGIIHVVGSRYIHHVPGLSLRYGEVTDEPLPEQRSLFLDGSGAGSIIRYTGKREERLPLDYTTQALAFHVRPPQRTLVVGAGGGADVLLALHHRVPEIDALEVNSQVASLMTGQMAEYSGRLFERPGVRLIVEEARRHLAIPGKSYDLIQLSGGASFGAASGGLHAVAEEYLFTIEAFTAMLGRLGENGLLAVTRYLKVPPRDSLRVLATALEALRRSGAARPEKHILFIRSWSTTTILVGKAPFSPEEAAAALAFCDERSFDTVFYAGMSPDQANRYDILPRPWFYEGAAALAGPEPGSFQRAYLYNVAPPSDDRPYFSRFFRWDRAAELFGHLRREWLPRVESGYVFLLTTLTQATVAGAVLILFPLLFLRGRSPKAVAAHYPGGKSTFRTLSFFAMPGFGFMFFEMTFIPKFTLLLAHPVYAAAVVLSVVLVFAGLGSLSLMRLGEKGARLLWIGWALLGLWLGAMAVAGDLLIQSALAWNGPARLAVAVLCLALPAFVLGWPFPLGLREVSRSRPGLAPWAWGVNGCASVMGAVLGKCLAMDMGFRGVMVLAWILYLLAAMLFPGPGRERTPQPLLGIRRPL